MYKGFNSWLQDKINETVDVMVEIPPEKQKRYPRNIDELCSAASYEFGGEFNQIMPDGYTSWDDLKGVINFYMPKKKEGWASDMVARARTESIAKRLVQWLRNEMGVTVNRIWKETYKDYNTAHAKWPGYKATEINLNDVRVYRIQVEINPEKVRGADMPPDVNMVAAVAKIVFEDIYGLPSGGTDPVAGVMDTISGGKTPKPEDEGEWQGYEFSAQHIVQVYERLAKDLRGWATMSERKPWNLKRGDVDPDEPHKLYKGPEFFSSGIDSDRIVRQATAVYELAKWAIKHGYTKMYAV